MFTLRRRAGGEAVGETVPGAAPPNSAARVGDSCGGYRLVRLLGTGHRASVYLGHADGDPGSADGGAAETPDSAVAVKIFHASVPLDAVDTEIEALSACGHEHTLRLLDVASDAQGRPCLVLERLAGGSLSRLVADRDSIEAGEAVTILAPLVSALQALHTAGVAHGGIRLSTVHFRSTGAPVLAGFGSATIAEAGRSEAALAADEEVAGDWRALRSLVGAVLARVPGERAADMDGDAALDQERLFELADPAPVRLDLPRDRQRQAPGRLAVRPTPVRERAGHRAEGALLESLSGATGWLRERLREVRPRFWLLAAAVGVSICAALVLVPPGDAPNSPSPNTSTPAAEPGLDAGSPVPAETPAPSGGPVAEEDPLAALPVLLAERERCLRELSVQCLDAVLQRGSAAMASDSSLIRSIQNGGEIPPGARLSAGEAALVERLGDSAIVDLRPPGDSEPASLLMMRGEAGWLIRSYLP